MTNNQRLVFSATPYADESLPGFVLRLTELNQYDVITWILDLAKIPTNRWDFSLSSISVWNLQQLQILTGVSESALRDLWYEPVNRAGTLHDYSLFGNPVPRYTIRVCESKICPECLRERLYARKIWEFAAVTACPLHRRVLLDRCPRCNQRIGWRRTAIATCVCEFDWRSWKGQQVTNDELHVAQRIYQLCNLIKADPSKSKVDAECPLTTLSLSQLLSALFFIVGQFQGLMDTRGKRISNSFRNKEIHSLIAKAYKVFQNWPNNFFSFLDWKRENNPDSRHGRGLRRDFGQYKSALYVQLADPCYDFLREGFEEYIATQWRGGYPTTLSRLSNTAQRKYLTVVEAKQILNVTPRSIKKLIAAGKLTEAKKTGESRLLLIEAESVINLRDELKDSMCLNQTAHKLGTHAKRLIELVESKLLTPIRGPVIEGNHEWRFSSASIDLFLTRLAESVVARTQKSDQTKTLRNALQTVRRAGGHCGTLIKAVFDGEVHISSKTRKPVLSSILFSAVEIADFARGKMQGFTGKVHSLEETAQLLKTNLMEVYFLANKGLLNAKLIPGFESLGRFINSEDVSAFSVKYVVLTRTIAKKLDTDTGYIVAVLRDKNIHPISGRTIDGGLQYIFSQVDLANLDLRELISNYRATDHSTVPTCSLDLKEVCSALSIDEDSAHRMVQNGFLRSSIRYRRPSTRNRYFLQPELVGECRRRKLPFASLLSIYIAAKRVGIVVSTLRKAILRGALPAIQSEKHLHCFYIVEEDLDAFVETHRNRVGAKAAAEILQLTKGVFNRLVKKGVLERVSGPNVDGYGRSRYLKTDVERIRDSLRLKH